jgi:hypothetical protein
MSETVLVDDFGRRTVFTGEKLVEESTDNIRRNKPQWIDVDVWRTQAGSFVVQRITHYRIRHLHLECGRAEGYELSPATEDDTYPCRSCNRAEQNEGGWRQEDRTTVDVYLTPQDLIQGFQNEGRFSTLARTILADISEQDDQVDALWNTVVVP